MNIPVTHVGGAFYFEPGQTAEEKRSILLGCGFTCLDDSNHVVCTKCGANAVWGDSAKAGEAAGVRCSNDECPGEKER